MGAKGKRFKYKQSATAVTGCLATAWFCPTNLPSCVQLPQMLTLPATDTQTSTSPPTSLPKGFLGGGLGLLAKLGACSSWLCSWLCSPSFLVNGRGKLLPVGWFDKGRVRGSFMMVWGCLFTFAYYVCLRLPTLPKSLLLLQSQISGRGDVVITIRLILTLIIPCHDKIAFGWVKIGD